MYLRAEIECPYCKRKHSYSISASKDARTGAKAMLCDMKEQGCDNWFASFHAAFLKAEAYPIGYKVPENSELQDGYFLQEDGSSIRAREIPFPAAHKGGGGNDA